MKHRDCQLDKSKQDVYLEMERTKKKKRCSSQADVIGNGLQFFNNYSTEIP